jgi:phosphate butyryltransferase
VSLTKLSDLIDMNKSITPKKKVAVAVAEDDVVLEALNKAVDLGICEAVLFGNEDEIKKISTGLNIDYKKFEIRDFKNKNDAIKATIKSVSDGETDLPMKGKITTGELLSVFLKEEYGLRTKSTMNLISVFEINKYHKPLIMTDGGMVIAPDLNQKIDSINNAVKISKKIGVELPKVAIVAALEKVNPKMQPTVDAAIISQMNRRGQIKDCIVDGPFAMDNAVSKEAAKHKGIESEVAGDADIIIMPDIEAGNIFYKSMVFLSDAKIASTILGGKKPIVLTSRADSNEAKLYSIALSVLMS